MSTHLIHAIDRLKRSVIVLGTMVEENLEAAMEAVSKRDARRAHTVAERDRAIDQREVEIEEECLKMLALYQPVATDLRFIVAVLKLNRDLERIGDLAVNIAERVGPLADAQWSAEIFDFEAMAGEVRSMLRQSLDALVELDAKRALRVFAADDTVDAMHRAMFGHVRDGARADPDRTEMLLHLLSISRHLERIADHAANIAKDVVYMVDGEIVRHRTKALRQDGSRTPNAGPTETP